jgi:hypothetical protein
MRESEMNEINQIRERFLADARQYFLAGDNHKHAMHCPTQGQCDHAGCTAQEPSGRREFSR